MTEEKRGINSYSRKANINTNANANTNTNIQILKYKYAWGRGRHVAQGIFARQTNDNLPASSSINICCKRQYLKSRAEKRIVEMWKIKEKPDRLANQIKSNQFYRQMRPAADWHNYFRIQRQLSPFPIPTQWSIWDMVRGGKETKLREWQYLNIFNGKWNSLD